MDPDRNPRAGSRAARLALTCLLGALAWLAWPRAAAGQRPDLAEVSVWLHAFGGHTFFRRLERNAGDGEPIPGVDVNLPNVPFLRVGLSWRMPSDDAGDGGHGAEPTGDNAARR